jgi:hypothetical protein
MVSRATCARNASGAKRGLGRESPGKGTSSARATVYRDGHTFLIRLQKDRNKLPRSGPSGGLEYFRGSNKATAPSDCRCY